MTTIPHSATYGAMSAFAQAIEAGEKVGLFTSSSVELADVWALYNWTLEIVNINNDLPIEIVQLLKDTPFVNSNKIASETKFPKHPDDHEIYLASVGKVNEVLRDAVKSSTNQIAIDNIVENNNHILVDIVRKDLSPLYSASTGKIAILLLIALRSVIKDGLALDAEERFELYKKATLIYSAAFVDWQFR